MDKLFLLGVYALIYRSYYAFINNPRINSKGLSTSAIMGFCNTLNEVLTKENPTYIGVVFDHGLTFRNDAFPAYKAQREAIPEDIKKTVPIIKQILEAYHIPSLQVDGSEADDVIGTLAMKSGEKGIDTYMLTLDKDYGQLVRENVFIYRPRHGRGYETLGEKEICDKYNITTPLQVIGLLALMGDSADNFPGCPGVGERTVSKLINQFGPIEELLKRTSEIKGKLRGKVENATDGIKMSQFLVTIRTDVLIELNLEDLKLKQPDENKLAEIFTELEFKAFANRILNKSQNNPKITSKQPNLFAESSAIGQAEPEDASSESLKTGYYEYKLIGSQEEAYRICDFFLTDKILSLDTGATPANPMGVELIGLSFAAEPKEAFYMSVPTKHEDAVNPVKIFRPLYENEEIVKVG